MTSIFGNGNVSSAQFSSTGGGGSGLSSADTSDSLRARLGSLEQQRSSAVMIQYSSGSTNSSSSFEENIESIESEIGSVKSQLSQAEEAEAEAKVKLRRAEKRQSLASLNEQIQEDSTTSSQSSEIQKA